MWPPFSLAQQLCAILLYKYELKVEQLVMIASVSHMFYFLIKKYRGGASYEDGVEPIDEEKKGQSETGCGERHEGAEHKRNHFLVS